MFENRHLFDMAYGYLVVVPCFYCMRWLIRVKHTSNRIKTRIMIIIMVYVKKI